MKLSGTQLEALRMIAPKPMKRGLFSGWGPHKHGYGAHRVDVREATANKLISLGLVERWDVEGDPDASTLRITDAGRSLLAQPSPTTDQVRG